MATTGTRNGRPAVVRRAVELGVNHIDTAGFYFSATASANESSAPRSRRTPTTSRSSTKVGPGRDVVTGAWGDWARPEDLRAHVEHNLDTLGLDRSRS